MRSTWRRRSWAAATRAGSSARSSGKLAASAYAYFDSSSYDTTTFSIGGTPREGVTLEQIEAAMDKVLAEFLERGPTPEEMARAKNVLKSDAIYARDSQATMAQIYGVALTTGSSVEDVRSWPERIEAVTPEEVVAAPSRRSPGPRRPSPAG